MPAQLFETADGYLALFVTHDEFWRRLCVEIGEPEWADDPRFATMHARFEHRAELLDALGARLREASATEWAERLRPLGHRRWARSSISPTRSTASWCARGAWSSPSTRPTARSAWSGNPIRFDGEPPEHRPPPRLHEHTADLLDP